MTTDAANLVVFLAMYTAIVVSVILLFEVGRALGGRD